MFSYLFKKKQREIFERFLYPLKVSFFGGWFGLMDSLLTLDMILELPNEMLKNAEKYNDYSELLRKDIWEQYDLEYLKDYISERFTHFKDLKYLCNYSFANESKMTANYNFDELKGQRTFNSQLENNVNKNIDNQLWMSQFYNILIIVSSKLTLDEVKYLIYHYFSNKSEDFIAEKIGYSKVTLQNIKKSCLIKLYNELNALEI